MEKLNLILVEDEPAILQGITALIQKLEDLPLTVTGAYSSGQEALDNLEKSRPDIVITDVQMPVMSGLELISKLQERKVNAEYLVLSGYAEFEYVQRAIQLSVNNYLLKSPRISELREVLSGVCDKILQKRYQNRRILLQNIIFQHYRPKAEELGLSAPLLQVFLYMAGPYAESYLDIWKLDKEQGSCAGIKGYLEKELEITLSNVWILNGYYPNMKIIAAALEEADAFSAEQLFSLLKKYSERASVTLAASPCLCGPEEIPGAVAACMSCLKKKVRFGKSTLLYTEKEKEAPLKTALSRRELELLDRVLPSQRPDLLIRQYHYFAEKWKEEACSQAECFLLTRSIISQICSQIFRIHNVDIREDVFEKIAVIAVSTEDFEGFTGAITALIDEIYQSFRKQAADTHIEQTVEFLWELIHKDFARNIDVNAFAKAQGYHPVYLTTQFSRLKGISPTRLIIRQKMEAAKVFLRSTEMNLKEIAEAVGYCDVSYFSRTFKEHESLSPSTYRRQQTLRETHRE